jgi:hypothetical protein
MVTSATRRPVVRALGWALALFAGLACACTDDRPEPFPRLGPVVFNYTSPLDGPDVTWQRGQAGHTLIYRADLTFSYGEESP